MSQSVTADERAQIIDDLRAWPATTRGDGLDAAVVARLMKRAADMLALSALERKPDMERILDEASKPTPEQARYAERSDQGENIGAIITPSKWFDVGMKTAIGNVRRLLAAQIAEQREEKTDG